MTDDTRYLSARHRHLLVDDPEHGWIIEHARPVSSSSRRAYIVVPISDTAALAPKVHNKNEGDVGKGKPPPLVIPTPSAVTRAQRIFSWFAMLAPRRVWREEVGDALETIGMMEALGRPRWQIWLKIASTIVWVLLNGIRELAAGLTGRKSPHK